MRKREGREKEEKGKEKIKLCQKKRKGV